MEDVDDEVEGMLAAMEVRKGAGNGAEMEEVGNGAEVEGAGVEEEVEMGEGTAVGLDEATPGEGRRDVEAGGGGGREGEGLPGEEEREAGKAASMPAWSRGG